MRKGLVTVAVLVVACTVVGSAGATTLDQAYIYWQKSSDEGITGVRSGIGNPSGSELDIPSGDASISSVWATNGAFGTSERGLQQGIVDLSNATFDYGHGTCQNHTTGYFYFVETDDHGTLSCYYEASASGGSSHLETVLEDGSGNWWGWRDGTKQTETSISWTDCGGNTCFFQAFGEDPTLSGSPAYWQAKFSGSGNNPWQFYNGTQWNTIYNFSGPHLDANWTTNLPTGVNAGEFPNNDPTALWHFIYNP
jgi:hypothetical protein